jgi:cysteine desulfurase
MRNVYLEHLAASPILPEVRDAILPYLGEVFGNPSSVHAWGDRMRDALDKARSQVAELINSKPSEITFTSCGTESNNLAIKGLALARQKKGRHVLISAIEHASVLNVTRTLAKSGFEVEVVPVDQYGTVAPAELRKLIRQDTILVSVMLANPEVGTIEPVRELASVARETGVLFHTDAVAAVGAIPVDVQEMGADALSLGSNQFYGPPGVAALWLREGLKPIPQMDGGVQESSRRAGTENLPGIVGMGAAAEIAGREMQARSSHLETLRAYLLENLPRRIEHVVLTGHPSRRLPGHASICVEFVEGEAMLLLLNAQGVGAASGSSCTSKMLKVSHVLLAMGFDHTLAQGSLLFSLGRQNSIEDIDYLLEVLPPIVTRLRHMSPLYAKFIKGGN